MKDVAILNRAPQRGSVQLKSVSVPALARPVKPVVSCRGGEGKPVAVERPGCAGHSTVVSQRTQSRGHADTMGRAGRLTLSELRRAKGHRCAS